MKKRTKVTKAVILARVSSKEQEEGYSIEAQKERLFEYCQKNNLQIIKVFEIIESSSRGDRIKFKKAIKFAQDQKETIAVVCDKVDRLQRRISDMPLLSSPVEKGAIELHFRTESYIVNNNSGSNQKFMWGINVLTAQALIDNLSDNVKRSFKHKLRRGECIGKVPIGYKNVMDDKRKNTVIVDEERGRIITRIFQEYATGVFTISDIIRCAKKWGLRSKNNLCLGFRPIRNILINPFYYGQMKVKGELFDHRYPILIERTMFMKCKDIMNRLKRKKYKYAGQEFLFKGLITCVNSGKLSRPTSHTKNSVKYRYLIVADPKNPAKTIYVKEDQVIAQIQRALKAVDIQDSKFKQRILDQLKIANDAKNKFTKQETTALKKEYSDIETKEKRLFKMRLGDEITCEEYQEEKNQLMSSKREISDMLKSYDNADEHFMQTVETVIDIASGVVEKFKNSDLSTRRKILKLLFVEIKLNGYKLEFTWRSPFDLLAENGTIVLTHE